MDSGSGVDAPDVVDQFAGVFMSVVVTSLYNVVAPAVPAKARAMARPI